MNEANVLRAQSWYEEHKAHVNKLLKTARHGVEPSREDARNPALWKDIHWAWFFASRTGLQ